MGQHFGMKPTKTSSQIPKYLVVLFAAEIHEFPVLEVSLGQKSLAVNRILVDKI